MKKIILSILIAFIFQVQHAQAGILPLYRLLSLSIESMQAGIDSGKFDGIAASKIVIQLTTAQDVAKIQLSDDKIMLENDMKYTFYLPSEQKKCTYYPVRMPSILGCGINALHKDVFHVDCVKFSAVDQRAYTESHPDLINASLGILESIYNSDYLTESPFPYENSDSLGINNTRLDSLLSTVHMTDANNDNLMIDIIDYFSSKDSQHIRAIEVQYFPNNDLPITVSINGQSDECRAYADMNSEIHAVSCNSVRP
ncbi:MAG TPA: hypothetical protein PKC21_08600 [Oligoflexia bacterium]|nr:hypothetical protein [Oligoflexia bacterium]HMR25399.1 hypothetical protein [Oligoflexia bacterium]